MKSERVSGRLPAEEVVKISKFPMPNEDSPCGAYASENGITFLFERTADSELIAVWRNLLTIMENHSATDFDSFGPVTYPIDWHIVYSNDKEEFTVTAYSRFSSGRKSEISLQACETINAVFAALSEKVREKLLPRK